MSYHNHEENIEEAKRIIYILNNGGSLVRQELALLLESMITDAEALKKEANDIKRYDHNSARHSGIELHKLHSVNEEIKHENEELKIKIALLESKVNLHVAEKKHADALSLKYRDILLRVKDVIGFF